MLKQLREFLLNKNISQQTAWLPIFRFLVLTLAPRHPYWVYRLAVAERNLKRYREALPFVENALALATDSPRKRFQWLMRRQHCHDRLGYAALSGKSCARGAVAVLRTS